MKLSFLIIDIEHIIYIISFSLIINILNRAQRDFSIICRIITIISGITIFSMTFSRYLNDYYRKESKDIYCSFRGYFGYSTCSILNNSFFLQAIYRSFVLFIQHIYISKHINFNFNLFFNMDIWF